MMCIDLTHCHTITSRKLDDTAASTTNWPPNEQRPGLERVDDKACCVTLKTI